MDKQIQRNPYHVYESILRALSAQRIARVRSDQQLILDGWQIHFAIDPYDIGKFCFPFSPAALLSQFETTQIDEIARLQNGRYEAIYKLATKPILLEPYIEELEATRDWAKWSSYVPTKSDLLDRYLRLLKIPVEKRSREVKDALRQLSQRDISSLVAIVTGIVSIGFERLDDVLNNRLIRGSPNGSLENAGLFLTTRGQVASKAFHVFEEYFRNSRKRRRTKHTLWSQRSKEIIEINNRRDSIAVDHLLLLNEIYNPQKCLILYLSSSPKSADLFGQSGIRGPVINGRPYDLVRTAKDLFIFMVYRGDFADPVKNAEVAISKLSELEELIHSVGQIRDRFKTTSLQCEHCNRDASFPLCEFGSHCEGVLRQGEHIVQRQEANINLSMQKRLSQAIESVRSDPKATSDDQYGHILKFISEILEDKQELKAINQEMEVNLQSSVTKMRFVSAFVTSSHSEIGLQFSCYLNYFPVRIVVQNEKLRAVVANVIGILPRSSWSLEKFCEQVGVYLKEDANWDLDAESELVRCFLYSILKDHGKAIQIADRYLRNEEQAKESILKEFQYLKCFTLWHADEFEQAIEVAKAGIQANKRDPRFYHCRSIVLWDLLRKNEATSNGRWKEVIDAADQAIELFTKAKDKEMAAVNCNNVAYVYAADYAEGLDAGLAEKYLKCLIRSIPEPDWTPKFPEFYHTKGSVLLTKFLISKESATLIEAYDAAVHAFELFPEKREHRELKETLEKYSREFEVELPQSRDLFT
jgi:tetratricopeptide (TPR) repeat protein